ncbi:hypothetical protein [Kribbella sp. CA-247076]|uniref:hypothetical protein n=1 Tax=Kribbella sp. CA-247076 TaxID=3239941 RepID=UPI003D929E1D
MDAAGSLEELLARSGPAAVMISGAEQSAWSGEIVEATGESLGLAHWDGTLYLGERILDPLRQMYARSGERQPTADLVRYRESLATILHEHAHFLGPADADQEAARGAFIQPGGRQLEEGITEAWARDHLNDFLTHLGVDKVAPGIEDVHADGYYPAFVPAARILTTDLEKRTNLNRGDVLNTLNRQTAEGQLPTLVALLYNSTRLPDLDSAEQAAANRTHLEALLRDGLARLDAYQHHPPGFAAARSRSLTGELLTRVQAHLTSAESAHHPHPTACALPAPRLPTPTARAGPDARSSARLVPSPVDAAFSGLAPPTAVSPIHGSAVPAGRVRSPSQALSR